MFGRLMGLAAAALLSAVSASFGQWIQWRASEGGNDHWYRLTQQPGTWHEAEREAVAGGSHLVTINDAAEQQWLVTRFGIGGQFSAWIGFTDEAVEGTWVFVAGDGGTWQQTEFPCAWPCDGVSTGYVDWHVYADGEPNNNAGGPGEDWAIIGEGIDGMHWGDYSPDIAVTPTVDDKVVLLYGLPGGTFDPVNARRDVAVADGPAGMTWGDFNQDGHPDLAVGCVLANVVTVLFGDSQGLFDARSDFATPNFPVLLTTADLDRDGWEDIVASCLSAHLVSMMFNRAGWGGSPDCDANGQPDECQPDCDSDGTPDACELLPIEPNWTQVFPVAAPSPRRSAHMAFDAGRGVTVLFGGFVTDAQGEHFLGDTWEYNGTTWQLRHSGDSAEGPSPPGRYHGGMVYDSSRGRCVLHGGADLTQTFADTWEWNGQAWTLDCADCAALPRAAHAMAFDGQRGVTVLFGGNSPQGRMGDTWEFDGTGWTLRSSGGSGQPVPREVPALAYDAARQVTVLYGGNGVGPDHRDDTWEWDGTSWVEVNTLPGALRPSPHPGHAMAYHALAGGVVLFGGGYAGPQPEGDTWLWNGSTWSLRSTGGTADPAPRFFPALSYDSGQGAAVLFGGVTGPSPDPANYLGDTWEFDFENQSVDCNGNGIPDGCDGYVCEDGNPCTDDACNGTACAFTNNTASCDDGDGCTDGDICTGGACVPGAGVDCDDGDLCTDDWCDAMNGCQHAFNPYVCDSDGDGVVDNDDECPGSDVNPTIHIDGCDTNVANLVFYNGCTMADLIAYCASGAANHGAFVRCVVRLAKDWRRAGLISAAEYGSIVSCAAQASVPGQANR